MGKNYTYSMFDSKVSSRLFYIIIITVFITLSAFFPVAAQQEVLDVENYISNIKNAEKRVELANLIYDVQPTVYFNNGVLAPIGEGPMRVANIGASDIGRLQEGHVSLQTVKLLLISFQDLQELQTLRLQPTNVGSMPNLEYVFLSLGFDDVPAETFSGIQGFDGSEIVILYESARPF